MVSIEVRYKLVGAFEWRRRQFEPSDYFWADPDRPNELWDVDSVPQHNRVGDLLKLDDSDQLDSAITHVADDTTGECFRCAYRFWGGPEDFACMVTHHGRSGTHKELIFSSTVPFKENGTQTVRIALDGETPRVTTNCFTWGPGGDDNLLDMLSADERTIE